MMKLRKDPAANATLGGAFTQQNAAILAKRIGRKPTDGELYIAHFFGAAGAARVIQLAARNPQANAAALFPAAARANGPIFYDKHGHARSVAGVYSELVHRYQVAKANTASTVAASTPPDAAVASPAGATMAFAASTDSRFLFSAPVPPAQPVVNGNADTPGASLFHSLFETGSGRGPVSAVVTELWGAQAAQARARDAQAATSASAGSSDGKPSEPVRSSSSPRPRAVR
jgi:hypothetical protein